MCAKRRFLIVFGLSCLLFLAVAFSPWLGRSAAQVSGQDQSALAIPYTASLFDQQGNPIEVGVFDFSFALYDAETGGTLLWSENQKEVEVKGGQFTVLLGSLTPLLPEALSTGALWLEISVRRAGESTYTPLAPRQPLSLLSPTAEDVPTQSNALSCEHTHFGESWSGSGFAGLVIHTPSGNLGGAFYGKTGGIGYGVAGEQTVSTSAAGGGVAGFSNSASGYGGYFENTAGGIGLSGKSNSNYAVRGESGSGVGVFGKSTSHDGLRGESSGVNKSGVYGYNSQEGYGVFGRSPKGFGLGAEGKDDSFDDFIGDLALLGEKAEIIGTGTMDIYSYSSIYLDLDEDNNDANACLKVYNGTDSGLVSQFCEDGTKSAVLGTKDFGQRAVYVIESPEVWLEDFGTATLINGSATVAFDPIFAQVINPQEGFHVQLTPVCQQPLLLFVVEKTTQGFTVQGVGLDGSPSNCSFDYTITVKRAGTEELRLEEVLSEKDEPK
jgi:hypothetical protein